jgi:putative aldouronate transport system substrate-binding protein
MMRKDWLDELGLSVPETIDEWYTVLKAFKDKKGASAPLTFLVDGILPHSIFIGAYGAGFNFYVDGGKVKYGQAEPSYKEFLTTMNKWYKEGLLDNNLATLDGVTIDANMTSGKSGASNAGVGGGLGKWLGLMKDTGGSYDLTAVPYPSLKKGEKAMFNGISGIYGGSGAAISASSKHPVLAAKLLDYFYGKEGDVLSAFGTEGVTYNMVGGEPKYTDYVMNNPDGYSMAEMLAKETRASFGPCVQSPGYFKQYAGLPQQQAAIKTWADSGESSHIMPYVLRTAEEEKEFTKMYSDINTFTKESMMGFISGQKPLSEFDAYISTLNSMKVGRAVEIMQNAYDRYLAQ